MSGVIWAPNPGRQTVFYTHPARTVGYGGSAGSGKTDAMLFHHWYLLAFESQRYERGEISSSRAWCVYFRRTTPNLRQAWDRAIRFFPLVDPEMGMKGWNASDLIYTYTCGVKYMFAHIEKPTDYFKYQSFEFIEEDWDELTEFEEEQFDWLDTRLRSSDEKLRPFINRRWGTNPIGPGLEWVRRRFVDNRQSDVVYRKPVRLGDGRIVHRDEVFIQAYLKDNPHLFEDGSYEASLRQNKPHIAKAILEGNWYVAKGSYLGEFWNHEYHVCEDHEIPRHVFRFRSCDFGIGAHSSITHWYVDDDGCFTAYNNLYLQNLTAPAQAERIKEVEKFYGDWNRDEKRSMLNNVSPLDAQCFKRHGGGGNPTIADDFWENGVGWTRSTKDRFNGLAEVCKRLDTYILLKGKNPPPGQERRDKKPMIRWMKRCLAPIRYLPIIPSDPENPGEVMKKYRHLHVLDDTMFGCSTRPLRGSVKPDGDFNYDDDDDDDFDELKAARNRRESRRIASILG